MRAAILLCCLLPLLATAAKTNAEADTNPIAKVLQMIGSLQAKVIVEGETEQKQFEEFQEWCEDESKGKKYEIKTGSGQSNDLKATIEKAQSDIDELDTKIGEMSSSIASNEADLKAATTIRENEHRDFSRADKDLMDTVETLDRAVMVLGRELGGSFLQANKHLTSATPVLAALQAVVSATGLSAEDQERVQSFLEQDDAMDAPQGAPAGKSYEKKSGGILETLQDMLAKSQDQRAELQKAEKTAKFNFLMLKMSLEDQMKTEKAALEKAKKDKAATNEAMAAAQGDLEIVSKDLAEDHKSLADVQQDCMERASGYETSQSERAEELKALAMAKKIIQEATGEGQSFVQMQTATSTGTGARVAAGMSTRMHVMKLLRSIGERDQDSRLTRLAGKIATLVSRNSFLQQSASADPFKKVKGMIQEMVEKLLQEARKEAEEKAYCDKEMTSTKQKRAELEEEIDDFTARIDKAEAQINTLTKEVAELQKELAELASSQQEMDKMRTQEHDEYKNVSAETKKGLEGIRLALKVLRDYYAKEEDAPQAESLVQTGHEKQDGAAGGIISMLEVAESDLSKNLADVEAQEDEAQSEYEKVSQENKVTKATKNQDAKYKSQEKKSTQKAVAQTKEDRDGVQGELDAVLEYYDKLVPKCTTKAPSYEERKKRREDEIEGLKNALEIMDGDALA